MAGFPADPDLIEFIIRLLGKFPKKNNSDIARIAMKAQPELCDGKTLNALKCLVYRIQSNALVKADNKDIEEARKIFKTMPKARRITEYDMETARIQTNPAKNR